MLCKNSPLDVAASSQNMTHLTLKSNEKQWINVNIIWSLVKRNLFFCSDAWKKKKPRNSLLKIN